LIKTSTVFVNNASIFGKVYFPRLILPMSIVCSNLLKFAIQFVLFLIFLIYYSTNGHEIQFNTYILLIPLLILIMAGLGLGLGIIISSLTTKYRDFQVLVSFGVQLLMYATPIAYPLSLAKEKLGSYYWVSVANPMTAVIETLKYAFFGEGEFSLAYLTYSFSFMIVTLTVGIIIFNKVEQTFMDTV
jgi:lipopolysaccharide transport system permease protein